MACAIIFHNFLRQQKWCKLNEKMSPLKYISVKGSRGLWSSQTIKQITYLDTELGHKAESLPQIKQSLVVSQ